MRQLIRPLMLLVAVSGCTPDTRTDAERLAAAARADSSAAGYEVGPSTPARALVATGADSVASHTDSGGPRGPNVVATGTTSAPVSPSDRRDTTTNTAISTGTIARPAGRGADSSTRTAANGQTGRDNGTTALPALDPALEPTFLVYDTTKKTAIFQLAAGDEIPDEVSFNGARRGGRTLTIPLGWRVTVAFTNRDPGLPHSATIVDINGAVPEELPEPVFLRGQTVKVDEGMLEGDADEIIFTADRVGRYLLACGVLGHAQRGQWLTLDVSTTALVPKYR